MGKYGDYFNAKCPFFLGADTLNIKCEGLIDKSAIVSLFQKKAEKVEHKTTFCDENYEDCILYKSLDHKYQE